MPEGSIVDLEELVLIYARNWYDENERHDLEKQFKQRLPWDKIKYTVDRSKFFITHETPVHVQDDKPPDFQPRQTVLFKSNYNNTTEQDMEYNISTERRTRTTVSCTITRGFRIGASFELGIAPPGVEAKLEMSSEINFEKSVNATEEKEVSWRIDTRVHVPPKRNVVAELCVKEDEYKGTFTVKSLFSGKIYVDVYKDNTDLCRIVVGSLRKVLTEEKGFQHDRDGRVYFVTKGVCNCRFGLEQDVHIRETPMLPPLSK